jgi:ribose transport system substrate-binding protein
VAASSTSSGPASSGVVTARAQLQKYEAAPTTITVTAPLKSAPPTGKTLVMLGTPVAGNVVVQKALAKLASMVHWNFSVVTYDPANIGSFSAALDTALSKHPNYVAEDGTPLTPALTQKVQAAGAKWVLTAVYPARVQLPVVTVSDAYATNAQMGRALAYYFVSDSGGKGNAVIEHVPSYPILGAFTSAFTSTVKSLCQSCTTTIVNVTIPDLAAGKVPSIVVSALRRNPSANYLVFDYGPFADGVTSALAAAGLASKVKVIGQAADQAALSALKSGQEAAWTGFDPTYESYTMFDAMFRDLEGMPIPQAEEALQPTQILTKSNVGSINVSNEFWSEPADALQQFKKLWKIG